MKLKLTYILPLVISMILLSSCSVTSKTSSDSKTAENSKTSIYNNDEEIASAHNTFRHGEINQKISDKMIECKVNRLEGMETIWSYTPEEDMDVEFSGEISVKSGKAKLVLISPDNTLNTIVEKDSESVGKNEITQTLPIKKGPNHIKIVAEKNTELELNLSCSDGQFEKIGIDSAP